MRAHFVVVDEPCDGKPDPGRVDVQTLTKTYGLSTFLVAKMIGVAPATLRQNSTSPKVRHGLQRLASLLLNVRRMFDGDMDAVKAWLNAPHPDLGRTTPMMYLVEGHVEQVESLVDAYLSGQPD